MCCCYCCFFSYWPFISLLVQWLNNSLTKYDSLTKYWQLTQMPEISQSINIHFDCLQRFWFVHLFVVGLPTVFYFLSSFFFFWLYFFSRFRRTTLIWLKQKPKSAFIYFSWIDDEIFTFICSNYYKSHTIRLKWINRWEFGIHII